MRSHAKAASAGSTSGRGKRHARIAVAFACVFSLLAFAGSGASSALAAVPAKGVTGFFGTTGSGAGQLNTPRGVAVNQASGNVYAVDANNSRVVIYDSNGKFLRAFGADVVLYGPGQSSETQIVAVAATSGNFKLSFGSATTANLSATASAATVQAALNGLETISAGGGSVTVTGGPGDATGSTPYRITFNGGPLAATDVAQIGVVNEGLSGGSLVPAIIAGTASPGQVGFEICVPANGDACRNGAGSPPVSAPIWGSITAPQGIAVNQTSGDLYVTDQANRRIQQFDSNGNFIRTFGKDVVETGFPGNRPEASAVQTLTVTATEGKYKLKFGGAETAELAFNATAAEIQAALQGLASIGAGNATVSETSAGVFKITFAGALANNPEPLIATESGPTEPLIGGTATVVNTTTGSNGFETCVAANGGVCKAGPEGAQGTTAGAFAAELGQLAVAPVGAPNAGNLLVADASNRRVQEFSPAGQFIRAFGFDVVKAGPGQAGSGFETCVLASGDACQAGAAGSGSGQFATATPTRIAEDAAGNIYTVEPSTNFRVQRFTLPGNVVTPQGNFAEADLKGTSASNAPTDVAVNPANGNVLVNKAFPAASTPSCPITGAASVAESRVVEVSSAGALEGTHGACVGMTPVNGLALRGSSGNLYVSSTFGASRIYVLNTGQPVAPTLAISNLSGVSAHAATINALINPGGPELPYGTETTYAIELKRSVDVAFTKLSNSEATAGNRTTTKAITVSLNGLQAATSYDVRLTATKPFGSGSASQTVSFETKASAPDVLLSDFATLNGTSARLTGMVNPNNKPSGYHFEYVGQAGFEASGFAGATHVPVSDVAIGSGSSTVDAKQDVSGLAPGQTYHYRLVASNPSGQVSAAGTFTTPDPTQCANATLRGEQSSGANATGTGYLPDCMALEMVSPPKKYNQKAEKPSFAASGDAIEFYSLAALDDTPQIGLATGDPYVATRSASGWTTHTVQPPLDLLGSLPTPCSYNMDLSKWTVRASAKPPGSSPGVSAPYQGSLSGGFSPLGPVLVPLNAPFGEQRVCEGGSADASRFFFGAVETVFLPGDPVPPSGVSATPNQYEAYLDEEGNPTVELLTRDKDGKVWGASCGATVGRSAFGTVAKRGAISADGSRVYFTARPGQGAGVCPQAGDNPNKLRVMKRLRTPAGPVISELSTSECTRVSPPCNNANGDDNFMAASQEGGLVFFTTTRQLVNGDLDGDLSPVTGTACSLAVAVAGCDLYLYNASLPAGSRLIQVSAGDASAPSPGKGADVRGVLDIAGDGSHAYFVADGVLTTNPNAQGARAESGKRNLYLYQRDADHPDGRLAFIGALATNDSTFTWSSGPGLNRANAVPLLGSDPEDPSVGGDGHILVFSSKAPLTPGDTDGARDDLYRYDAETGSLQRISAAAPGGSDGGVFNVGVYRRNSEVSFPQHLYFGRMASEDGGTIVFNTPEALDPADTDGVTTAYVWRDGSLTALRGSLGNEGFIHPTVSTSGDVAFVSDKQLLPQDGDSTKDVYVAREGGGFPLSVPEVLCQGEACQEPSIVQPQGGDAASESFVGPGNQKSAPAPSCPKGKREVKRKGKTRCVAKKARRKASKQAHRKHTRDANANRRAGK